MSTEHFQIHILLYYTVAVEEVRLLSKLKQSDTVVILKLYTLSHFRIKFVVKGGRYDFFVHAPGY